MLTETDLEKICDFIFNESTASETEVIYSEYESSTTRFSSNVITQNLNQKNRSLTIRVIHEKREGTAECNELNHDTLRNTLEKAMESRAYQHPNNELLPLAQPQEYQTVSNYHEKTAFLTPLEKVEWIKTATQKAKELQMESSGIFDSGWKLYSIANSHGLKAYHKYSMADFNYSVEKDKASGWYEMSSHSIDNINLNTIIDKALDSAIKSESPTDIKPGDYTVILTAEALSELFYFLVFYGLNTVGILEKSNFFHDKLGEKVL
ncbi:MAG: metallopeptidase TldD-related protein, partial [Spirochaetota bacterium]|nr:metallopeptidase TldD-related protein [Spirochaetota bacterium]